MNDLPFGTLSAFDVPDEVRTVVGPETTSLPVCRIGIVDTSVHTARIETERIRNAEMDPRIVLSIEREQRIRIRSCRERRILAQSRNVLLVHPIEILEVGRNIRTFQLRTVSRIERPAFFALAAIGLGRAIEVLAFPDIEAGKLAAACKIGPDDAVGIDVDTAGIEAGIGNPEDGRL